MDGKEYMLTTFDNPYNPFEDFENWWLFDNSKGYNTCGKLARIVDLDEDIDEDINQEVTEKAMDDLINADPLQIYRKVCREDYTGKSINMDENIEDLKKSIESREIRTVGN